MNTYSVSQIARLELVLDQKQWLFALRRRDEIEADFAARERANPRLWNGKVLMLHHDAVVDDTFHGRFLVTDFASFNAWREWGCPPTDARDCFAAAVVVSADGGYLLGEMGPHSATAGHVYFPCGMPDTNDVFGRRVDFAHNVARELMEETGLDIGALSPEPGWTMVRNASRIVLLKVAHAAVDSTTLRSRVLAHLAREEEPELSAIHMIHGAQDHVEGMRDFVKAFLAHRGA